MSRKRKKPGEAREEVAVGSGSKEAGLSRRRVVGVGLSLQAKRELLTQFAPQYGSSSPAEKKGLLDAFTRATGYHRKYAMWLLNHPEEGQPASACPRPRQYGSEVQEVLVLVWEKMNYIGAKRLMPFLPPLLEALERHEHLHLSETCREHLLSMSAATAERLLHFQRRRGPMVSPPRGRGPCSSN
jgi:hypothetical protein